MFANGEAPVLDGLYTFPMGVEKFIAIIGIQKIEKAIQRSLCYLFWILQLDRAGREISRVGICRLAMIFPLLIESFERGPVHKNFAPDFKHRRVVTVFQSVGNAMNCFYVVGHFVTLCAVSTGHGTD